MLCRLNPFNFFNMKKLNILSTLLFLFVTVAVCQNNGLWQKRIDSRLQGKGAPNSGPAPDYSDLYFWAASPYKHDPADSIPAFLLNEKREELADVFFIHPTTYLGETEGPGLTTADRKEWRRFVKNLPELSWNADLSDETLNYQTDIRPILFQASVFNGSCRIFAPRYRQANIKAFFVPNSVEARQAFDLAYSDIKKAFEYYLSHDNNNRPIIIASHSQGSMHAIRLLREFFDGKPLQNRLVCAYIIGHQIPRDAFKNISLSNSPTATGGFVSWRTFQKGKIPKSIAKEEGNSQCVNPLTWKIDSKWAPDSLNLGALFDFQKVTLHFAGAGIEPNSKILWVTIPESADSRFKKLKNFHVFDYNLFWMNMRENVRTRINAYLILHSQPEEQPN